MGSNSTVDINGNATFNDITANSTNGNVTIQGNNFNGNLLKQRLKIFKIIDI